MIDRRQFLADCAAAVPVLSAAAAAGPDQPAPVGVIEHSYSIRAADLKARTGKSFRDDPASFADFCKERGAAGVQIALGALNWKDVSLPLSQAVREQGMYVEGSIRLPRSKVDLERFQSELPLRSDATGVSVFRTAILEGRRYEAFATAGEFRKFADDAFQALVLVKPVIEGTPIRLAIENHKDWRADQLIKLLERVDSENIGVCLDTGNNLALLEDPMKVVDALAPWAITTHLKDIAVEPYEDGFLMSEVPYGTGILDLKRIVKTLRAARPDIHLNVEMITRDPLKIPCLTDRYWATFEQVSGLDDVRSLVREHRSDRPLPRVSGLALAERLQIEDDNVRRCLAYARQYLAP
jgi:hypothetical protein